MVRLRDIDLRSPEFALALVLFMALAFGGGGAAFGILNLVVQAVAILAIAFHHDAAARLWRTLSPFGRVVIIATVALPLLQAVPLPPSLWASLPGRDLVGEAFDAVGLTGSWFSFSVDARRSLLAASALIAPLVVLALVTRLPADRRDFVLKAIVALAVLSIGLGAIQLLTANEVLSWYPNRDHDELYGFFANHNATGLFFVIAMCCLAALDYKQLGKAAGLFLYFAIFAALAIATILTQSRSSTALLLLPLGLLVFANLHLLSRFAARTKIAIVAGAAAVMAGGGALLFTNAKLAQTWVRFDDLETSRPAIWEDTLAAIQHFWPLGSGTGSYRDAFEIFESLESVDPLTAGRAHNDYLELALESGIVGIALLLLWFAFIWLLYIRAYRSREGRARDWVPTACMVAFAAIALQSAIDYPLRNQALLCVAAALLGILLQRPTPQTRAAHDNSRF